MNKKLLLPLLCVIVLAVGFIIGRGIGVKAERLNQQQRASYLHAVNDLAQYRLFVEMSQNIAAKRETTAQCTSDLLASAKANSVRDCLATPECRHFVSDEVKKQAPELLEPNGKLPFHYYAEREECPAAR